MDFRRNFFLELVITTCCIMLPQSSTQLSKKVNTRNVTSADRHVTCPPGYKRDLHGSCVVLERGTIKGHISHDVSRNVRSKSTNSKSGGRQNDANPQGHSRTSSTSSTAKPKSSDPPQLDSSLQKARLMSALSKLSVQPHKAQPASGNVQPKAFMLRRAEKKVLNADLDPSKSSNCHKNYHSGKNGRCVPGVPQLSRRGQSSRSFFDHRLDRPHLITEPRNLYSNACPLGYQKDYQGRCVPFRCPNCQRLDATTNQCVPYCPTSPACRPPLILDNVTHQCVCPYGLQNINGQCVRQCPHGMTRDFNGQCFCPPGLQNVNGQCVPQCPPGMTTDINGQCICLPGLQNVNSQCVPQCSPGMNRDVNGNCVCPFGQQNVNGRCVQTCPVGYQWDPTLFRCIQILSCPGNQEINPLTGQCSCKPGTTWDASKGQCSCQVCDVCTECENSIITDQVGNCLETYHDASTALQCLKRFVSTRSAFQILRARAQPSFLNLLGVSRNHPRRF